MEFSHGTTAKDQYELSIRSAKSPWLRRLLIVSLMVVGLPQHRLAHAEDPPPAETLPIPTDAPNPAPSVTVDGDTPPDPTIATQNLPDIETRNFGVAVSKRSRSGRMYLFDDVAESKTRLGKILLLRRDDESVMAFRVMRLYEDKKQFAAKRVRRYGEVRKLEPGDSFTAIEKIGDLTPPPPTNQDNADLKELESNPGDPTIPPTAPSPEVQPYDSDLDSGTSPPESGGVDSDGSHGSPSTHEEEEDEDPSRFGMAIDEVTPIDHHYQWLSGSFGYFNNAGSYFAGGGLRYGLSLGKMIFLRRSHLQDSFAIEGGVFYYKIINFMSRGDAYGVVPLIGTARYNIMLGENFTLFFYGGIMQNFVTEVSGGDEETQRALQAYLPAAGGGMLFRVGPSWDARVDLGYDMVGLGLVLRF
jgi:hypothetical protein